MDIFATLVGIALQLIVKIFMQAIAENYWNRMFVSQCLLP